MELISRNELKEKLDRKDSFKLVMVLGEWAYRAKHIPGSLNVFAPELAKDMLDPEDDIIIYCSDENCPASKYAYMILTNGGFQKVRRYAGGIADWEEAGYPMEGAMVK
jgi:rhodanese-related sulfurtransferase